MVRVAPPFARYQAHQVLLDVLGRLAQRQAHAARDAKHVGIDGNGGFFKRDGHHDAGSLSADAREGLEFFARSGHVAAVPLELALPCPPKHPNPAATPFYLLPAAPQSTPAPELPAYARPSSAARLPALAQRRHGDGADE